MKMDGKLMFILCRKCGENKQHDPCEHNAIDRQLTGTWCTIELLEALDFGYVVISCEEIWHFEENSTDLFKG